jgi:hypothetical protein
MFLASKTRWIVNVSLAAEGLNIRERFEERRGFGNNFVHLRFRIVQRRLTAMSALGKPRTIKERRSRHRPGGLETAAPW